MSISVFILTLNEKINIAACIESVAWSDDIVVLDSLSSDATREIARAAGARVVERTFDNWAAHQNWAMDNITFKHPWVLYIDADERCTEELRDEIIKLAQSDNSNAAYRLRRKDFFMGRWLKRAQLYPTWIIRLFRPKKIRYERLVNPVAVVDGPIGELQGHLHHYPFSHGISHWIDRHNRYSSFEAIEARKARIELPPIKNLFSRDPNIRRTIQKELFFRLPGRPLVKFFYYYFIRRGFLDGYPGFVYCALQAIYGFFIACKQKEIRQKELGLSM